MLTHRYTLPGLSGILLALVFYPFYLWPLVFLALAPFFYFAGASTRSKKELFWDGFIAGVIGIGPTVFSSLFSMRILIGSETFSYLVRASALPVLLLVACSFGLVAVCYGKLRTKSLLADGLIGAALYGLHEIFFSHLLNGYYLPSLSYAAAFPGALLLAPLGGAFFVSMSIAWVSATLAEVARSRFAHGVWPYKNSAVACALLALVLCVAYASAPHMPQGGAVLPAAVIQEPYRNPQDAALGVYKNGTFTHPQLAQWLTEAGDANLIIYPFTPFRGAAYDTASSSLSNPNALVPEGVVGEWAAKEVSASTTVLLWESALRSGKLYDEYALWRGSGESTYTKRVRYPFSDYAPAWTGSWNLFGHTYAIEAGDPNNQPQVGGVPFGGLICSELHQSALARQEALRSPFIVAVGSDAMFPNDLVGNYSLAAARFRAAENGVPIVRANMNGPSAFINADGSIQSSLGFMKAGILQGTLPLTLHARTLYAIWGNWLAYGFLALVLAFALLKKR